MDEEELYHIRSAFRHTDQRLQLVESLLWKHLSRKICAKVLHKVTVEEDKLGEVLTMMSNEAEGSHIKLINMLQMEKLKLVALVLYQPVHLVTVEVTRKKL